MTDCFDAIVDRFVQAGRAFETRLRLVGPHQWTLPTPCAEWDVRQLVNHTTRGNLNYVVLAAGGDAAEFLRLREVDAVGDDPMAAVRTADTAIHTWDLARAVADDDTLDAATVAWIDRHLDLIYAGLAETPTSAGTTHRFFAAPDGAPAPDLSPQHRLLHRMGRNPLWRNTFSTPR